MASSIPRTWLSIEVVTVRLASLLRAAEHFDGIVLDQWGVLHDGTAPYPHAINCLAALKAAGLRLAVLSNSGKRAAPNLARIAGMGFDPTLFDAVMTSGEALWRDVAEGRVAARVFHPVERAVGDAAAWAAGLDVRLSDTLEEADAVLLMGLPDDAATESYTSLLSAARRRGLPVICTNPDRASPRADGAQVVSPGALAHDHAAQGGAVQFYGKPHLPVFRAVELALGLPAARLLMVGDSLEHDIAGARAAGWSTAFVEGGLHAAAFAEAEPQRALARLVSAEAAPAPDFSLPELC